jgi:hypothetical protein
MKKIFIILLALLLIISAKAADYLSFSSSGHPKAAGLDFTIDYPATWKPTEGNSATVQEFRDPGADEKNAMLIVIPPNQSKRHVTKDLIRKFTADPRFSAEAFTPGSKQLKKSFIEDSELPACFMDYTIPTPGLAPKVTFVRNYMVYLDSTMVQIQFYTVGNPDENKISESESEFDHVCRSFKKK